MFANLKGFLERHRRKIFIATAIAGTTYIIGRVTKWKLNQWYETQQAEFLVQSRKQVHFDGNQKTCATTYYSMLPGLHDLILELLDTESITETLKKQPENKILLWEHLKILSFARTITAVYTSSILLVFLRVQLNLLGGYMYLGLHDGETPRSGSDVCVDDANQKKYLALVRYFLEEGVKELVGVINEAVEGVLGSVSLKQKLSYHDVKRMLGQIRQCLTFSQSNLSPKYKLSSLILPNTDDSGDDGACSSQQVVYERLMNETADVLDSEDFHFVLNACLDLGFSYVMDKMKPLFIVDLQENQQDTIYSMEDGCCSIYLPLARIIPNISGKVHDVLAETNNDYVQDIMNLECARSFAANIYEAFSHQDKTVNTPPP